jgi:sulfite oxidase
VNNPKIDEQIKHVHFEGIDGIGCSIPVEKALNQFGDVMISYELNGEEISRDQGYPVRAIVPGFYGIRNVKVFLLN